MENKLKEVMSVFKGLTYKEAKELVYMIDLEISNTAILN